jgi:hypothetical protein
MLALGKAVFDRHILALDEAGFAQSLAKRGKPPCSRAGQPDAQKPDHTGIAFCCARTARAAVIALPRKSIKSRRVTR